MTAAALFAGLLALSAIVMAISSYIRHGRVRNWHDWVTAIVAAIVLTLALAGLARAQAFSYTEVFFGLEYPDGDGHPACVQGDNQLTSNVGINQNLYQYGDRPLSVAVNATYRHHSCAIGDDDRVTDTLGLNAVFRAEWR